jgi:hypothetical protein
LREIYLDGFSRGVVAMARKTKAQTQQDDDWKAGLEEAKRAKQEAKADWRAGKEEGRPDDQKGDYGIQDHTKLLSPSPDPGPEDAGEELKRKQAVPDGLNPQADEEKLRERTRLDPETGETLLPESVEERHEQSNERWRQARGGADMPEGDEGFSRSEETKQVLAEQWRDNPAMLGVGRNVQEEPVILVRAADLPGEGVDPAKRYNPNPGGGPGEGAPPALPAGPGERHHVGAAWPAPLDTSASAPSPSPEPGPEPSQQWHEPQNIVFADHDAAVRGTLGPDAEQQRQAQEEKLAKEGEATTRQPPFRQPSGEADQDPSRNSAGKLKHSYVADKMIETGFEAFGSDPPDHGTLQQALLYAQRRLRANWRTYMAERQTRQTPPAEPEPEQQPAGA